METIRIQTADGVVLTAPGIGIMLIYATSINAVPTDAGAGYAPGCLCLDTANGKLYVNEGSATSCDFNEMSPLTAAQEALLGATAGTASASKALIVDANIDIAGIRALSTTGDITHVLGASNALTLTCSDISAPVVMTNTMTTAAKTGCRALFHVKANVALGAWCNGLKGYMEFTGTSGRTTGLASGVCAELKTPNTTLSSGAYYPLEAEYVAGGTSVVSTGSGSRVGFLWMQHSGDIDGDFDDNGYLFSAVGLTAGAGHLLSTNSQTLKCQVGIAGSEVTRYVMLSQLANGLGIGASGTPIDLGSTYTNKAFAMYVTSATTDSNSIEPFYVESTMTAAGGVGGRARFHLAANAAQGGWCNALKATTTFGAAGSASGLGSCMCTDLTLSAGTTSGTYTCFEGNIVFDTGASLGTATSFLQLNAAGTAVATADAGAYLFSFGAGLTAASGRFIDTDKTAQSAYGGLRVLIEGVGVKYIRLYDAS